MELAYINRNTPNFTLYGDMIGRKVSFSGMSILLIDSVELEDSGIWTCDIMCSKSGSMIRSETSTNVQITGLY